MHGTHMGTYRGLPATGAGIALRGVQVFELDNYLIVESWSYFNRANLLNQIEYAISQQAAID
jgi:predicted ester cyclase